MRLNDKDQEKLMLHLAGQLAHERLARGVKLNYPEAVAFISSDLLELARDGHDVAELMSLGRTLLAAEDCMPGVPEMVHAVQVEATFPDGTKLVTVHDPIQPAAARDAAAPAESEAPASPDASARGVDATAAAATPDGSMPTVGGVTCADEELTLNDGRAARTVAVTNVGDRPVQVGSHFHFFEVNRCLSFDRAAAYGFRLDIPSGTSVRFEPGEEKVVQLVALGGTQTVHGLNALTEGAATEAAREVSLERVRRRGFLAYEEGVATGFPPGWDAGAEPPEPQPASPGAGAPDATSAAAKEA